MKINQITSAPYFILAIIVIAFMITATIWVFGVPNTSDSIRHFTFAASVYDSLGQGDLYVQGEPKINNGYGGYALRFYPVFSYYSISVIYYFTQNWIVTAALFFWFWMAVGGVGVFFLAREFFSDRIAFIAAVIYMIEPYHNAQIQNTYAYAEFVAGSLLTFCLLFVLRTVKYGKPLDIAGLALFYGLLILTHIPIAMVGTICLAIFALFFLSRENWKRNIPKLFIGFLTGAVAGSFHIIRLVTEMSWINHASNKFLTEDFYNYQTFFIDVRGIFFPSDLVLMNFLILLIPSLAIILLKTEKETKRLFMPLIVMTIFSIFMATSLSQFVWEIVPVLQKIQFPWRWLTVSSIGFGIIVAASLVSLQELLKEKKVALTLWFLLCIFGNSYFTYQYVIGANLLDADYFLMPAEDFSGNVNKSLTATHPSVWQTIWANEAAYKVKDKVIADNRNYEIIRWEGFNKELKIESGNATNARIAIAYYPHWKAKVNGESVEISKTDDGIVLVPVPAGEAKVQIYFVEPLPIIIALYLSGIVWLIMLGFIGYSLTTRFYKVISPVNPIIQPTQ